MSHESKPSEETIDDIPQIPPKIEKAMRAVEKALGVPMDPRKVASMERKAESMMSEEESSASEERASDIAIAEATMTKSQAYMSRNREETMKSLEGHGFEGMLGRSEYSKTNETGSVIPGIEFSGKLFDKDIKVRWLADPKSEETRKNKGIVFPKSVEMDTFNVFDGGEVDGKPISLMEARELMDSLRELRGDRKAVLDLNQEDQLASQVKRELTGPTGAIDLIREKNEDKLLKKYQGKGEILGRIAQFFNNIRKNR